MARAISQNRWVEASSSHDKGRGSKEATRARPAQASARRPVRAGGGSGHS